MNRRTFLKVIAAVPASAFAPAAAAVAATPSIGAVWHTVVIGAFTAHEPMHVELSR
jgi:hypothetical protein